MSTPTPSPCIKPGVYSAWAWPRSSREPDQAQRIADILHAAGRAFEMHDAEIGEGEAVALVRRTAKQMRTLVLISWQTATAMTYMKPRLFSDGA